MSVRDASRADAFKAGHRLAMILPIDVCFLPRIPSGATCGDDAPLLEPKRCSEKSCLLSLELRLRSRILPAFSCPSAASSESLFFVASFCTTLYALREAQIHSRYQATQSMEAMIASVPVQCNT